MASLKRWTNEEDQVIISQVRKSPSNLARAFKNAETKLINRSFCSISQRYYRSIRLNSKIFITVSSNSVSTNTKVGESILINIKTLFNKLVTFLQSK